MSKPIQNPRPIFFGNRGPKNLTPYSTHLQPPSPGISISRSAEPYYIECRVITPCFIIKSSLPWKDSTFFLPKSQDLGCSFSDPSTRNLDCLQARHLLCLQPRHLLCQQSWLASWPAWLAGPGWLALAGWLGWPGWASWLAGLAGPGGGRPGKSIPRSGEGDNPLGGPTRLLDSNCRTVQDLGRMVHVKHRGCLPAWTCTSDQSWLRGIVS